MFVVMDVHMSSATSPDIIFQLHLKKNQVGRHIWCDMQVQTLMAMVQNETGCPRRSQHWILCACNPQGHGDPQGLAQFMNGNEHLFELDTGGCKRFVPYHECSGSLAMETLGLKFRVHCRTPERLEAVHCGGRPRSERTKVLSMRSLLSSASQQARDLQQEDQETIYYVSDAERGEEEQEEMEVWEEEEEEEEEHHFCDSCGRDYRGHSACPACSPSEAFSDEF